MADPTIQTFCCHRSNRSEEVGLLYEFNSPSYNIVCAVSSVIGVLGAIYQLLPREEFHSAPNRWVTFPITRGRQIIMWLAVADLLASLGVFVRSLLWINYQTLIPTGGNDASLIFCFATSAWIEYFYMCTWLWTLCYAIDVRLVLKDKQGQPWLYHLFSWSIPAALTSVGLSILYIPNANCHSLDSNAFARILPNYCATYFPIAIIMIANPVLYAASSKDVTLQAARVLGQFTSRERALVDAVRFKFFAINAAFYVCWLPNLINGLLLWTLWFALPVRVVISLWYLMALTNPMQALLNSFVYRRWKGQPQRLYIPCRALSKGEASPCEDTPLLLSHESLRANRGASINGCAST
ncbi:G-protein coupled receptor 143-like [Neocloeon triangulifer]|uniref:G-protein coupled receptor 143-like n=1 Tax=Neocloeon triangulifer TaxID=2078957 RepID=UPI00286EC4C8|nr:G-protein coupled receptor 143-like [Neocloeon triangulifer]